MPPLPSVISAPRSALKALLCDEAGFLAEVRVRAAMDGIPGGPGTGPGGGGGSGGGGAASSSVRAEAVVEALGITDAADFDALVARLVGANGAAVAVEDAGLVDPETVIQRLKAFVEEELRSLPSRSARDPSHAPTTRALRRDVYEQEYWERLGNVVSELTCRVWRALHAAMQKYNALLEQRSAALAEMNVLLRQNDELRGLLDTYSHSKQAAALIIPPMI